MLGKILPPSVVLSTAPLSADDRRIALSFDDGPDEMTPRYLDTVDKLGFKTTFFVIGANCERHPDLVQEMLRRGHDVVPHGFSHKRFPLMTARELREELKATTRVLPHLPKTRKMVRPPGGHVTVRTITLCSMFGYTTALWSLNSEDCRTKDIEKIARESVPDEDLRPGDIILMHEGQEWTLEALPLVVERAKARGYSLCRVSDLMP